MFCVLLKIQRVDKMYNVTYRYRAISSLLLLATDSLLYCTFLNLEFPPLHLPITLFCEVKRIPKFGATKTTEYHKKVSYGVLMKMYVYDREILRVVLTANIVSQKSFKNVRKSLSRYLLSCLRHTVHVYVLCSCPSMSKYKYYMVFTTLPLLYLLLNQHCIFTTLLIL